MIRPIFGASMLSWIPLAWTADNGSAAIRQTAEAGFELLEILLTPSMDIEETAVREQLEKSGLKVSCSLNLPANYHIPSYPREATALIKAALDRTGSLGAEYLGGVLHGAIGVLTGHSLTAAEEDRLCAVWSETANYAAKKGIVVGIEPVNRYESYVCNTAREVISLLRRVGAPNLVLHLDTFHMNIEEQGFYDTVVEAGPWLRYIHMAESDRGMPGAGNVHWDELFRALAEIRYSGPLVLENFSSAVPGLAEAVSLWRPSPYGPEELAKGGLRFMRQMTAKWNKELSR